MELFHSTSYPRSDLETLNWKHWASLCQFPYYCAPIGPQSGTRDSDNFRTSGIRPNTGPQYLVSYDDEESYTGAKTINLEVLKKYK